MSTGNPSFPAPGQKSSNEERPLTNQERYRAEIDIFEPELAKLSDEAIPEALSKLRLELSQLQWTYNKQQTSLIEEEKNPNKSDALIQSLTSELKEMYDQIYRLTVREGALTNATQVRNIE